MSVLSKLEPFMIKSVVTHCTVSTKQSSPRWHYSGKLSLSHAFHRTQNMQYPPAAQIPLPNNLEDITTSEESRFSKSRSRDINGSLIAGVRTVSSSDRHIVSYDCSGGVSLSAHMQTNVPSPCPVDGMYTHFNMPRGLWGQGVKYVSGDYVNTSTFIRHFSSKPTEEEKTGYTALSRKDRLKTAVKEYGGVVIVFHVGISLMSLGVCYLAVTSGIDFGGLLAGWAPTDGGDAAKVAAPFVVAYAAHKVFAPVRISVTLVSVPFIVKYLRRIGFMKPPKPKSN